MNFIVPDINSGQYSCKIETETVYGHCRCCLEKGHHRDLSKLYLANGKQENYCDIFLDCFNLFLSANSNLTSLICSLCVNKLREAQQFKSLVMRTEHQLMEALLDCVDEQMVLVNVPVAGDTLDTTVGFKIKVNDVEDSIQPIPCNLADVKFEVEDGVLELQEVEMPLKTPDETPDEIPSSAVLSTIALINNTRMLLEHCNATLFKSKTNAGFPCFYCKKIFLNFDLLRKHQTIHSKNSLKAIFEKYTADNLVVYADVTHLKCTDCDVDIESWKGLKTHLIDVHEIAFHPKFTERVVPFKFLSGKYFECQICTFHYETFMAMERHMNTHFRNFVCTECGSGFVTNTRLRAHKKAIHKVGRYPCEICGRVFLTHSKHKGHVDYVHRMVKKMKCDMCSERFADYYVKQKHMVEVHGAMPIFYKCDVCNKAFSRKHSLTCHMRIHFNQRNVSCEMCTYTCFTNSALKEHMLKHSRVNNVSVYMCSLCNRSYSRKKTFKLHLKSHCA